MKTAKLSHRTVRGTIGHGAWSGSLAFLVIVALVVLVLASTAAIAVAAPSTAGAGALKARPANPAFQAWQQARTVQDALTTPDGRRLGFISGPQDVSYTRGLMSAAAETFNALPTSYDLRATGKVTSVKDQNPYGTCWAFATFGSMESFLRPSQNLNFSEDNLALKHGFDYYGEIYDRGGNYFMSAAYLARWSGPVYESDDAYKDHATPSGLTARKHVQNVDFLPVRQSSSDNTAIKNAVYKYGGVAVAMRFDGSSSGSSYYKASTHAYYYNGSYDQNHGVLVVGWNDNYAASNFAMNPGGNGAFLIKNSWGTGWGDGGYFWVSYRDTRLATRSMPAVFNSATSTTNYSKMYSYDPLGWVDSIGWGGNTAGTWMANVFTASGSLPLRAVGFYTVFPNSTYQIWTGSSLNALTKRTQGTFANMGYHTVALPAAVALTSGKKFVVAVKLTSPNDDGYPIAAEYVWPGYSSKATASPGQSYISKTGAVGSWYDLTNEPAFVTANVCLKAFAGGTVPAPTVTALTPNHGPVTVGAAVTITGTGFSGVPVVKFGSSVATSVKVVSSTQITCKAPAHVIGRVDVTVKTASGTSSISGTGNDYYFANRYIETDSRIRYTPATATWARVVVTGALGSALKQTKTSGSYATVKFSGTRLYLVSAYGPTMGDVSISVDGKPATIVHLYRTTAIFTKSVFDTGNLTSGTHIVRITWKATPGKYINIDAVDVIGTLLTIS